MNLSKHPAPGTKQPGEGFYSFVNKAWLTKHHIPKWQSEFSVSDEMENRTDKELLEILHSLPDLHTISLTPKTSKEHIQLLGYLWKNKNVKSEEAYLQVCLHSLMSFNNEADIFKFLGWLAKCSVPTFVDVRAREELHTPYAVRYTLAPGSLLLPLKYYLDPGLKSSEVWKAYEEFVGLCSIELGLPFLYKAIEAEKQIAKYLNKSYSKIESMKGKSLISWSAFEWQGFMEGLDLDLKWKERIWIIEESDQLKSVLGWMSKANIESILSILSLHLISFSASSLRKTIKDAHERLFQRALRGIDSRPP